MIQPITQERWQQAQTAEAAYHYGANCTAEHYKRSYECYFRYLGMSFDQEGKRIVEIGPGLWPAIEYCENMKEATVIEPLVRWVDVPCMKATRWIHGPLELVEPESLQADEVWLLNVMQHVIDPELFVSKCKQIAPVIRFFEPIDFGTSDCHPHTFTIDDFIRWFGHAERYKGGSDEGFHTADCAYGTWRKE